MKTSGSAEPIEQVSGPHSHVMDKRGWRDGGDEQSPHCLGQRNRPDVSMPREDLGKDNASHGGGDHEDWIGDVRRAEDDPHQERAQVVVADGFH